MIFINRTWFVPAAAPVEMPIGLNHLDSDFCWCDPIIEVDENGEDVVLQTGDLELAGANLQRAKGMEWLKRFAPCA